MKLITPLIFVLYVFAFLLGAVGIFGLTVYQEIGLGIALLASAFGSLILAILFDALDRIVHLLTKISNSMDKPSINEPTKKIEPTF